MSETAGLAGLFAAAFLSATVLPGASEAVLAALLLRGGDPATAILVASLANTLGSVVNWAMGRSIEHFRDRRWFPVSQKALDRGTALFRRFGLYALPFSFLPVVGDALTVAAGLARVPLWIFVLLVGLGKLARYGLVASATLWAGA
ncbi:YqaA family protein [Aurantimonas sp. Leaf443]|uniref:YqaA family protein n=1 Tax=Aurantimonas sp. Leaf443 TaxID=1736378 RepID=UPI0006F35088|nr:YqaA family protein [Aurantimonas sp. Leaf443]KQT83991.1 hypothetical protein ASG48_11450 [Aurantimonas sp. Leaf443]